MSKQSNSKINNDSVFDFSALSPEMKKIEISFTDLNTFSSNALKRLLMTLDDQNMLERQKFTAIDLENIQMANVRDARSLGPISINRIQDDVIKLLPKLFLDESLLQERSNSVELKLNEPEISSNISLQDPHLIELQKCNTISDLDNVILRIIADQFHFGERPMDILKSRLPLFTDSPLTLEEIGEKWGVTRERIRQIQNKFTFATYPLLDHVWILDNLITIVRRANSALEFEELLVKSKIGNARELSVQRLKKILEYFELFEYLKEIDSQVFTWQDTAKSKKKFSIEIGKFRSKIGLINLREIPADLYEEKDDVFEFIRMRYPKSIRVNNTVLARTVNNLTMFEFSIIKQLYVADVVTPHDLLEGVRRRSSSRGVDLNFPESELLELIVELYGKPCKFSNVDKKFIRDPILSEIEKWMIDFINKSKYKIVHRDQLCEEAIKAGISLGSVSAYQSFNPIFRQPLPGMISLVGHTGSLMEAENMRNEHLERSFNTTWNVQTTSFGFDLLIKPNVATLTSGVLIPNRKLPDYVKDFIFEPRCSCGKVIGNQNIKYTKSKFWTGFTSGFRHLLELHSLKVGQSVLVSFNKRKKTATFAVLD